MVGCNLFTIKIMFLFNLFAVTPGITKKEYRDRRQRLLRLWSDCLVVIIQ